MVMIVAGGRDFYDYPKMYNTLNDIIRDIDESITIISGGANGADSCGEHFAHENNISFKVFPADWHRFGKKAGYLRNLEMAEYAADRRDVYGESVMLVAFWDGVSKGTKHMIDIADRYKISVKMIVY